MQKMQIAKLQSMKNKFANRECKQQNEQQMQTVEATAESEFE